MAAVMYVVPASAAHLGGCSGENLAKTESSVETMADGDSKWAAEKEVAAAQTALLDNKWGVCAVHLNKALQATAAK
ncbi:hypothetical protein SAMN05444158_1203 [Bradyrhizobium canariense]|uniref:Uncharacterized protein n=1 Tax=Bradyrhizobium canariense TaxID=255045 RepID=A0A1H1PZ19_9BRAD|nr:hypothetical protein SAMN05444158_1203 [Bradyrhizobium canariense]